MIRIYSRHCTFSKLSQHKERPDWFSKEACFNSLLDSGWDDHVDTELVVCYDGTQEESFNHYLMNRWGGDITYMPFGSEAKGFIYLIKAIKEDERLKDDDIIYFSEDDYLYRPGWVRALKEGFTLPGVDMVTMYDHGDKYHSMYAGLKSTVYATKTCHWRTVPSTCHTFGATVGCLRRSADLWTLFCHNVEVTKDHEQFLALQKRGHKLVSSIPGFCTHVQPPWLAPTIDWEKLSVQR